MQAFRETMSKGVADPFSVVLKSSKLPMSLLKDTEGKASRMNLLSVEPFSEVFSKRKKQKRVKLGTYSLEGLLEQVDKKADNFKLKVEKNTAAPAENGTTLRTLRSIVERKSLTWGLPGASGANCTRS